MDKMKSLKNLFKSEDFDGTGHCSKTCAEIANEILDKFIEENGVKVYGWPAWNGETMWNSDQTCYFSNPTRQALIFDIEEIPLKQCEHKEAICDENSNGTWFKCRDCGKPVKAKGWESV